MTTVLMGAIALGLLWAIVTIGVFVSYRILDIADLSVEGTLVLGASVTATALTLAVHPALATALSLFAGAIAGLFTGILHTKLKIPALLSGILCMIALYSINIRVMQGTANVSLLRTPTLITPLMDSGLTKNLSAIIYGIGAVLIIIALLHWFLNTQYGIGLRATGDSLSMAKALGVGTDGTTIAGLCIANALVGLAGSLIAQYQGFSDIQMGTGAIVIGLASLFIGEMLFGRHSLMRSLVSMALGAIVYRIIIALVIEAGMPATDLKLFTALTVILALSLPRLLHKRKPNLKKEAPCHAATSTNKQNL